VVLGCCATKPPATAEFRISKGAAEVSPRYCVGVLRHSAHDGIAGKG
jgi:hypothetical protein